MNEMSAGRVRKRYKYKLTPTPKQEQALDEVLWRCRALYNTALEQRITAWERRRVSVTRYQQEAELKDVREAFPEYAAIHSHVLQDVLARLDKTYQAFFRRVKNGAKPGFPRFQGRDRSHSFTFKAYGNGARLDNGYLVLSQIGRIALRWSRPLEPPAGGRAQDRHQLPRGGRLVCLLLVRRRADGVPTAPLPSIGRETGLDVGLKVFLIAADGAAVENPRHYRTAERRLAKAPRRVSRRKKGSKRRKKAVQLLRRKHQTVQRQRQRRDFHHKTALALLRQYDVIYLEDLRVAHLVRNRPLAKGIADAGWAQFRTILAGKAAYAGRRVVAVPAQYTSQDCSGCGERVPKSLSVRTHVCPSCGLVLDRDENAARNSQWAGQALRGVAAMAAAMNRESAGL